MKRIFCQLIVLLTICIKGYSQHISQKIALDYGVINYNLYYTNLGVKYDSTNVYLSILDTGKLFMYYTLPEEKILIFQDDSIGRNLKSELDTLLFLNYYIHKYLSTSGALVSVPYSISSKKERKNGTDIYEYFSSFEFLDESWVASFSTVKGVITRLNLYTEKNSKFEIMMLYNSFIYH